MQETSKVKPGDYTEKFGQTRGSAKKGATMPGMSMRALLRGLGLGGLGSAWATLATWNIWATLSTSALFIVPAWAGPGSVVKTDQVKAELVAHAPQGIQAGQALWLGLRIEHQPHWHTYWKNPGDSGLPTSLSWSLPAGFSAAEIQWPTPRPLPVGPLMNFGYEGTLLLPVQVKVPAGFASSKLQVQLEAQWLVCKEVCIPEGGQFVLDLPTQAATVGWAADFETAWAAHPKSLASVQAQARVTSGATGSAVQLEVIGLPEAWRGKTLLWFAETAGVFDHAAKGANSWVPSEGVAAGAPGTVWKAQLPISAQRSESPAQLPLVLVAEGSPAGVRVVAPVSGTWPAPGAVAEAEAAAAASAAASASADDGLNEPGAAMPMVVLLALLGGVLLNLMPCVFPVLSLKVVGFAHQVQNQAQSQTQNHNHDRRQLFLAGVAYTVGVVASFLALAGVLLLLRAAGEHVGWGFQLQSPLVVAALAALFTLMGLNLAGVFEWGTLMPASWAGLRLRQPLLDSALTGVLAVAVASPCTAPFMGASIGLAVTWPAPQALVVFAALGLGMAAPYLAACAWPALGRALPKPGAWMVTFRQFMAFPMWATVVWLLWVLGQQAGLEGVTAALGLLLALSVVAWVMGHAHLGLKARRVLGLAAWALLAGTLMWAAPSLREATGEQTAASQRAAPATSSTSDWQAWSSERVQQALSEGRPVFVDFTAAWCVTCQFNKRTVLSDAEVVADFAAKRTVLLRADWTRRDPAITAELSRMRRSGVPVYVLWAPGAGSAKILSEVLSVQEVRAALSSLP